MAFMKKMAKSNSREKMSAYHAIMEIYEINKDGAPIKESKYNIQDKLKVYSEVNHFGKNLYNSGFMK